MIKLTKQQASLIDHRLTASDALVEVMGETFGYAIEDVEDSIELLTQMVAKCQLDVDNLSPIDREVLIDCIEGSTWVACESNRSERHYAAACTVMENISNKLKDAGLNIQVVPYW